MPFDEIIGQDRALGALRAALRRGALHHAYLFGGPPGTGKGSAARLLAQAANCEGTAAGGTAAGSTAAGSTAAVTAAGTPAADDPCGKCGPCRKIARGVHPDVFLLADERSMVKAGRWEPRSGRSPSKDIVVDQVRDLVDHRLAMKRSEGRRRFVVVDPADAMNPQAQNALLKTLEEPPDDTTLVLVASSPDALLPTIRSRCARVTFAPLPDDVVAGRLQREGRDPEQARLAAALAAGSLGRALELDADELADVREALTAAAALDDRDARAWLGFAAEHGKDRERARELCELLLIWLRDVLAVQAAGDGAPLALGGLATETARLAASISPAEVLRRREGALQTLAALRQNAVATLALERMLIGWFAPPEGRRRG
jgi:DNA polymerase-3 subunit delta'